MPISILPWTLIVILLLTLRPIHIFFKNKDNDLVEDIHYEKLRLKQ
jgi:hypothetical protein